MWGHFPPVCVNRISMKSIERFADDAHVFAERLERISGLLIRDELAHVFDVTDRGLQCGREFEALAAGFDQHAKRLQRHALVLRDDLQERQNRLFDFGKRSTRPPLVAFDHRDHCRCQRIVELVKFADGRRDELALRFTHRDNGGRLSA